MFSRFIVTCALSFGVLSGFGSQAETFHRHHDFILGTSLDLFIVADSTAEADSVENAVLSEIARLDAIFSIYDPESEISALNSQPEASLSGELYTVLNACEDFRDATRNALSCRIGSLLEAWREAEASDTAPSRAQLRLAAGEIRRAELNLDPSVRSVERPDSVTFDVNALAKGYIIDRALDAGRQASPDIEGLLVNIGGDLKAFGRGPDGEAWPSTIRTPDNMPGKAAELRFTAGALATSGRGPRDREIAGKSYSHIISPKNGWHVEGIIQASVFAGDAMTADALATALLVMPLNEGLALIDTMQDVEARVIADDGRSYLSEGWSGLEQALGGPASGWPDGVSFSLDFTIPELDVSNYERPYIAAWVADSQRNLIRILLLAGPEPRWMEENYYWHRRFGRKAGSLVEALSEPTRKPGQYLLNWDGLDDDGNAVPAGEYVLHVEAAREHGGHQHESFEINLNAPFTVKRLGGDELGDILVQFGPTS